MGDRGKETPLPQLDVEDDGGMFRTEETQIAGQMLRYLGLGNRDSPYLVVVAGANIGEMYQLESGELIIGRGENVQVRLGDEKTSRQHARIARSGDHLVLEDLHSANGTFVNGEKVTSTRILRDGDKIGVGARTILRFAYHDKLDETFQRGMYDRALRDGLYRALFTRSPMPTFVVDAETFKILAVNAAALVNYGYTEEECLRMSFLELDADEVPYERSVSPKVNDRRTCQHRTKNRAILDVDLVTQEIRFNDRRAWIAIANDVTERKRMEARLRVSDRMASVGTLAAGVAHEINNPLTYVMSNLSFISDALRSPEHDLGDGRLEELRAIVSEALDGAERIRTIVRDLKSFSKPEDLEPGPVDVHQMLNASANMAWNEIRHRARLVKDYAQAAPMAFGNNARLGQVFLNLLVNAAQAIPEGDAEKNEIRITTSTNMGHAVIEVRDTGAGIARDIQGQLFDPFFTTKVGAGTGLGLSICHNIITAHGGRMEVDSEVGKGTVFRVYLPLAASRSTQEARAKRLSTIPPSMRRGRILIVDDDTMVATALRRTLAREHDVTVMTSGVDVLSCMQQGRRFDVILCDLMMPVMTGMDLYNHLIRVAPDQAERMIFVTGGAFTPNARNFLEEVPNERLDKPFDPNGIRALVRRIVRLTV